MTLSRTLFSPSGIPIKFIRPLKNVRVKEKAQAHLECEMSSKDVHVRWLKDGRDITGRSCYVFLHEGKRAELIIDDCELENEGEYAIVCTQDNDTHEYTSSANLSVDGNSIYLSSHPYYLFSSAQKTDR